MMTNPRIWTPRQHTQSRQHGLALITAVLIVAIVATVAAYLSLSQQIWLRQAQNLNDRAQADAVAHGALDLAMIILMADSKDHANLDGLNEAWNLSLPPLPVEGGLVVPKLTDAQGKFNLNNLLDANGQASTPDIGIFQRLLTTVGLNPGLVHPLVDWLDADNNTRADGAEDIYYLTLQSPYRAANQRLQSVDELRLVRGFDGKMVDALRPYVLALEGRTAVNVNTADPVVLSALFTNLSLSQAKTIASDLTKNPLTDSAQLAERAGQEPVEKVLYDIKSTHFILTVDTQFGRLTRAREYLLQRQSDKPPRVVWQADILPRPADDTEAPNQETGMAK